MKNMEKKKEDSKVKISVTDITNENNSIDSKAITEREKSSNSKKIKISSVKSEDITDVIYVPSKKPSHAINYENTHVSVHHQRIIATSYSQKQDNNKYLSSRSKSQLPHYVIHNIFMIIYLGATSTKE